MSALLVAAGLTVGYLCCRISERWRMWRYMKNGGMG